MKFKYTSSDVAAALNPGVEGFGYTCHVKDPDGKICAWSDAPDAHDAIEVAANIAAAMNAYYVASESSVYGEPQFNANGPSAEMADEILGKKHYGEARA